VIGVRVRLGGDGDGRTLAVGRENVFPISPYGEAESMPTTSHLRTLPTSSSHGVYSRPLPTCVQSADCFYSKALSLANGRNHN
jgi:hypothetical protein